jgi:hypothetical protein
LAETIVREAYVGGRTIDFYSAADAVLAAGWRKMPSKDEIARALALSDGWPADEWEQIIKEPISRTLTYGATADAILALMDGDNE